MADMWIIGAAILILLIAIISTVISRIKTKKQVKQALEEAGKEHIKVVQGGSNFRTRISDYKKGIEDLRSAIKERKQMISKLNRVGGDGGRQGNGSDAEET